ncbi:MAG TPA: polysaccharide biosynthesis/export family protein, partial [Terriglobales bacterium]|nr:polysaccharide biosynthesis/export family protein [Terriglobales bacterium]
MRSMSGVFIAMCLLAAVAFAQQPNSTYAQPVPTSNQNAGPALPASGSARSPQAAPLVPPQSETQGKQNFEPLIGPGDLLKIGVLGAPDFDQELRVSGNGDAVIALVGAVHVGGQTTEEAGRTIRQRLMDGGFFSDPQVTVFVKEYATQGVSVLGEV